MLSEAELTYRADLIVGCMNWMAWGLIREGVDSEYGVAISYAAKYWDTFDWVWKALSSELVWKSGLIDKPEWDALMACDDVVLGERMVFNWSLDRDVEMLSKVVESEYRGGLTSSEYLMLLGVWQDGFTEWGEFLGRKK